MALMTSMHPDDVVGDLPSISPTLGVLNYWQDHSGVRRVCSSSPNTSVDGGVEQLEPPLPIPGASTPTSAESFGPPLQGGRDS